MSERYIKRFSLSQQPTQPSGAPVKICAGNLLFDTQQNIALSQIKYENISGKPIREVMVNIFAFDNTGNKISAINNFKYVINTSSDDIFFGTDTPVILQNQNCVSFKVEIVNVAFSDGTYWNNMASIPQKNSFLSSKFISCILNICISAFLGLTTFSSIPIMIMRFTNPDIYMGYDNKYDIIIAMLSVFIPFGFMFFLSLPIAKRLFFKKRYDTKERIIRWGILLSIYIIQRIIVQVINNI